MVDGCFQTDPGIGACPCACDKGEPAAEGVDWFKIAVIAGLALIVLKRTRGF